MPFSYLYIWCINLCFRVPWLPGPCCRSPPRTACTRHSSPRTGRRRSPSRTQRTRVGARPLYWQPRVSRDSDLALVEMELFLCRVVGAVADVVVGAVCCCLAQVRCLYVEWVLLLSVPLIWRGINWDLPDPRSPRRGTWSWWYCWAPSSWFLWGTAGDAGADAAGECSWRRGCRRRGWPCGPAPGRPRTPGSRRRSPCRLGVPSATHWCWPRNHSTSDKSCQFPSLILSRGRSGHSNGSRRRAESQSSRRQVCSSSCPVCADSRVSWWDTAATLSVSTITPLLTLLPLWNHSSRITPRLTEILFLEQNMTWRLIAASCTAALLPVTFLSKSAKYVQAEEVEQKRTKIVIVGAGLTGCLTSYLIRYVVYYTVINYLEPGNISGNFVVIQ